MLLLLEQETADIRRKLPGRTNVDYYIIEPLPSLFESTDFYIFIFHCGLFAQGINKGRD